MNPDVPVSRLGERALIQKIARWCGGGLAPRSLRGKIKVLTGIGDDAGVVKLASSRPLVATTDTLIEGTHFRPDWAPRSLPKTAFWRSVGYKAMAVNLSDLAAMGDVQPLFALVTLGLNGDISLDTVDNVYKGIRKLTRFFGFFVLGGDIIRSDKSMISITIVGELNSSNPLARENAHKNDFLMASGPLGLSSAGLQILQKRLTTGGPSSRILLRAHLEPRPRLKEGRILAGRDILATAALDSSDDLMTSLEILGEKSGVGFELELGPVPLHPALLSFCRKNKKSPYSFLLYGGEDYELIFTVPESAVARVKKKIRTAYVLGRVTPKSFGIQVRMNGRPFRTADSRFKHF